MNSGISRRDVLRSIKYEVECCVRVSPRASCCCGLVNMSQLVI